MLITLFSSTCFRISCKDSRRALSVGFSWYCSRRRRAKIFEGFEGSVRHHLHVACCSSIEVAIVFLTYAIIIIIIVILIVIIISIIIMFTLSPPCQLLFNSGCYRFCHHHHRDRNSPAALQRKFILFLKN